VSPRLDAALLREAVQGAVPLPILGLRIDLSQAKPAAVVVPVLLEPEPRVVVVLRASHLADHAGEVGFPGGKPDPTDEGLAGTALRELHEELGVPPDAVEILGSLTPVPVITGRYLIHGFVGLLEGRTAPQPASAEIARVLEIPILPLLTGERPFSAVRGEWAETVVFAPHFEVGRAVLYGASAYIFYELLLRIAARLGITVPEPVVTTELPWGDRYSG
jgi:8-oxo-dGTP pyrophosphatase MutT (NUDIX family)